MDKVIREILEAKLDEYATYWSLITENTLRGGNTSHGEILSRATEFCRKEMGECIWPDVPKKY